MRKLLDAAAATGLKRQEREQETLEKALHAAREEQNADSLWVSEHGRDFALGFLSACLTGLLVFMIVHAVTR